MRKKKTSNFAFDMDGKENFVGRLKQLMGNRSARAAASEWGLSFSTLHNYLTRGTEPSFTVVQGIAYKEHVSLDWLAFGSSCTQNEVASTSEIQSVNEESLMEGSFRSYLAYDL
ncbi:MAG: helix-turn-helix domain-containing protein [Sodalis sp. (in: enterobacteria)]|uniref:helix-turn-helix domain-containing protein n=1 Tax=Sodalis sp. (in: enterobacteria) TaxID=1898979 RepID=UPI003F30B832